MTFKTLVLLLLSIKVYSQSKYTAEQVELSDNPQMIANFIKFNPKHPKTPIFREKLYKIITATTNTPSVTNKTKKSPTQILVSSEQNSHRQKTVNLLNHLFDTDPNKKQAYVSIENHSNCDIIMLFSGKKSYTLKIKQKNQNFILIDKGHYTMSSNVCNSKYSSIKNIIKDITVSIKF